MSNEASLVNKNKISQKINNKYQNQGSSSKVHNKTPPNLCLLQKWWCQLPTSWKLVTILFLQ